jgi:hypothetical protein
MIALDVRTVVALWQLATDGRYALPFYAAGPFIGGLNGSEGAGEMDLITWLVVFLLGTFSANQHFPLLEQLG